MKSKKSIWAALCGCGIAAALCGCDPKDGSKQFADGWAAYEAHDLKKADRLFGKSLAYAADNVDALVSSARVKLELGEVTAAREIVGRAAALAPKDADVMLLGAQIAYHAKDYKAAASAFAAVADDGGREAAVRADALAGLAVVEAACNEPELARVALLKAIRLDRRNPAARYNLALVYRDGFGYHEAALEQFEIYVRLSQLADVRAQRVERSFIPGLKETIARKAAERPGVDKRDSTASATQLAKGDEAWKKGSFKTARTAYAAALKSDPLSYPAALALARCLERLNATASGRRETLACYQTACSLRPTAAKTLVKTGAMALSLGQVATAQQAYSRAVAADPNSLEALDGLIASLRKTGGASAGVIRGYRSYRDLVAKGRKQR